MVRLLRLRVHRAVFLVRILRLRAEERSDYPASLFGGGVRNRLPDAPDRRMALRLDRGQVWPQEFDDDFRADDVRGIARDRLPANLRDRRDRRANPSSSLPDGAGALGR